MALRELTGTALAVLALGGSLLAQRLPASSNEILPTLAVLIGALIGAAVLQGNPGTIAAATVLGWFGIMFAQPFSLSTREFNGLRRRRGATTNRPPNCWPITNRCRPSRLT